jgi:hypothetical protein
MKEIILGVISLGAIGWLAIRFLFEPIYAQRKLISDIIEAIVFNSNWIANPGEDNKDKRLEVADKLRKYSSALEGKTANILLYEFWSKIGLVKNRSSIEKIQDNLIYLSNNPFEESTHPDLKNYKILKLIKRELGIKIK